MRSCNLLHGKRSKLAEVGKLIFKIVDRNIESSMGVEVLKSVTCIIS